MLAAMREASTPTSDADAALPHTARSGYVLAVLVLLASLLVVVMSWRNAHQLEMRAAEADFVADTEETTTLLSQRLAYYELVTRGGVSLFASVARPSRRQFQDYVDGLTLSERFPAVVGLGFAIYVSPGQLSDLQVLLRDSGEGLFAVRPHGLREHYGAIFYLEPKIPENLAAIGYDMYAEPVRHAAMAAALDSGQARLSGLVHLVQDYGAPIPALVMFQPVYRAGDHPARVAARRESMQGWIYIPFRMQRFVDIALGSTPQRARFRIVDVTDPVERVLYADPPGADRRQPAFVHSTVLEPFGRRWRLDFESEPREVVEARIAGLRTTLVVGLFASLLLFGIALTLVRTQARAEQLAARMSESYRRSELRFRNAMQYSAIGDALLDREGRIVEVNPTLAVILGSAPEALVGAPFEECFVEGKEPISHDRERDALADGAYRTTRTLLRGDSVRQVQLTYAPVPGDIGQDIARLVQVEDVTDRVRAQAQVLALNRTLEARVALRTRELTQANQALETFAYSVSHDLRAPLRAIDGFSRLLAERHADTVDETGREYVARVRNAAGRMGELIESLLKMSRVGRGGMNAAPLEIGRMAAEILAELQAAEPERKVRIEIAPELRAIGDPALVRSLLQNLLGNAWKFSRDEAVAWIELGHNDAGEFFVRDNGAGFAPEYADKLFRPFQRLHSQDQFSGDGIGLASVKRIVERHGGTIRAEGMPGEGATFYFTLPEPPQE
ncbi:MAG: CHASE domain-containing protein [Luteimonas sp.]